MNRLRKEIDKEKAAIEDYIYDEPGKVKPYSTEGVKEPWKKKLIEYLNYRGRTKETTRNKKEQQRHRTEENRKTIIHVITLVKISVEGKQRRKIM